MCITCEGYKLSRRGEELLRVVSLPRYLLSYVCIIPAKTVLPITWSDTQ